MSKTDTTRNKIKSKISAIKKLNDNPKSLVDNSYDAYKDQLDSTDGIVKKKITDFTSKIKGNSQNKKNIFGEVLDISEGFLGTDTEDPVNTKTKPLVKTKILKYAKESAHRTLQISKQTLNDETKKIFFEGTGICNPNKTIGTSSINLSPKTFDFMNMLKVDPSSISGSLMYESSTIGIDGDIKFNRELYSAFDSVSAYDFKSKDGNMLFSLGWDSGIQEYIISGLTSSDQIGNFLDNYYNTIEYPDIEHIFKTAMLMSLQGDSTDPTSFNIGMRDINRLISKLFSVCGSSSSDQPLLNNTSNQLSEDEYDIQNYFDFDDIEGIDLDDEDSTSRRVLKFRDCCNFEVSLNSNYMEDFTYLLDKKNLDENILNTLNKAARDAYEQSDSSVTLDGFQLSLTNSYILKIPKAIIVSLLSPKMIFPISVVYKIIKNDNITAKELMKTLYNLFFNLITSLFWSFIKEFWNFIKRDILNFVKKTAITILKNKLKKIKVIIEALISFLKKVLETNIGCCDEIYNVMLQTISDALNKSIKIPIPGLLLVFSESLPGYSGDRAYMNIMERLEVSGINTGPIYGTENKLPSLIKSIIDGHNEEIDKNSFVKVAIKPGVIPVTQGAAIISPLIEGVGKIF
jgi:hypothetical protein